MKERLSIFGMDLRFKQGAVFMSGESSILVLLLSTSVIAQTSVNSSQSSPKVTYNSERDVDAAGKPDASTQGDEPSGRSLGSDAEAMLKLTWRTIKTPLHWNESDFKKFAIWSGVAITAFPVETRVAEFFRNNRSRVGDTVERIGFEYGSPRFTVPFTLLLYGTGAIAKSDGVRDTATMMAALLLTVGLVQQPVSLIAGRARPRARQGHVKFKPISIESNYRSFISGHSLSAVGISVILAEQIDHPLATAGATALALTTLFGRLYSDAHWLTDVILGSAIGYYQAKAIRKRARRDDSIFGKEQLTKNMGGLSFVIRF